MQNKIDKKMAKRAEFMKLESDLLAGKSEIELVLKGFEQVSIAINGLKNAIGIKDKDLDKPTKDAIKEIEALAIKNADFSSLKNGLKNELDQIDAEETNS